jgi:hypothetical protein
MDFTLLSRFHPYAAFSAPVPAILELWLAQKGPNHP